MRISTLISGSPIYKRDDAYDDVWLDDDAFAFDTFQAKREDASMKPPHSIDMPLLGASPQLGAPYNHADKKFYAPYSPFNKETIDEQKTETPFIHEETSYDQSSTLKDRFSKIDLSAEMKASLAGERSLLMLRWHFAENGNSFARPST